jgi:hypothetical protein
MRNFVKLLLALGFAVALSGCVIRPWHPHRWHVAQLDVSAPTQAAFLSTGKNFGSTGHA